MTTPGAATQWLATFHLPPRSLRLHVQTFVHYRNRPAHYSNIFGMISSLHPWSDITHFFQTSSVVHGHSHLFRLHDIALAEIEAHAIVSNFLWRQRIFRLNGKVSKKLRLVIMSGFGTHMWLPWYHTVNSFVS